MISQTILKQKQDLTDIEFPLGISQVEKLVYLSTFSGGVLADNNAAGTPSCSMASVWSSISEMRGDTTKVMPT